MGRKKKAAKAEAMATVSDSFNPPPEMVGPQPITHIRSSNLSPKKKASKDKSMIPRRSSRLQNLVPPLQNQVVKPITEEINLIESEKEDEQQVDQITSEQPPVRITMEGKSHYEPASVERNFEVKVDYLVQSVEEFKSETTKGQVLLGSLSADLNYKSLYIDSQKKVQELTDQNHELAKALTFNLGKVEAYEKIMLISNLGRASEKVVNVSPPQAIFGCPDATVDPKLSPANKRKHPHSSKKN